MPDINKTDLVARLRTVCAVAAISYDGSEVRVLSREAADAIEALMRESTSLIDTKREQIEALTADNRMKDELLTAAVDDYNKALGEIARLRDALRAETEACAAVADVIASQHEDEAPFEDSEDYRERKLVYAKHIRRVSAAIRSRTALEANHE